MRLKLWVGPGVVGLALGLVLSGPAALQAEAAEPPPEVSAPPEKDADAVFVQERLDKVIEFNFAGEQVRVVIDYFRDRAGLTFVFDRRLLNEESWGDPIEMDEPKITVGAALKKVLDSHQMSMVRQGRVLWICRAQDAKGLEVALAAETQADQQARAAAAKFKPVAPQAPPPDPKPKTPTPADQKAALALDTAVSRSWADDSLEKILDAAGKVTGGGWKIDPDCGWKIEDFRRAEFSFRVADESSYEVLMKALHTFELTWRWEAGVLMVIPRPQNTVRDFRAENAWVRQQLARKITFTYDTDVPLAVVLRMIAAKSEVRIHLAPRLKPSDLAQRPLQLAMSDFPCDIALACALRQAGAQSRIKFGAVWISEGPVNPLPPGIDDKNPDGMYVLTRLQKPIEFCYDEETVQNTVDHLLQRAGVAVAYDPALLADPRFKEKVNLSVEEDKIMNALAAVLAQRKLGCALEGRTLWICRQEDEAALRKKFGGGGQAPAKAADDPAATTPVGATDGPTEAQVRAALEKIEQRNRRAVRFHF